MGQQSRNWGNGPFRQNGPFIEPRTVQSGILRLYVDGTAGNDAAAGMSWGTAWKTCEKAAEARAALCFLEPQLLFLEIFLRGTFAAQSLRILHEGPGQVYVGQHVDDFTAIRNCTVAAVGGEAGPPKHGMERLTLAGDPLDGTEVGMTMLLTDPITGTNRGTGTIVRVNVASQYVWTTQQIGGYPAWVAASPAVATIRVPSVYVDGDVEFGAWGVALPPPGTTIVQPRSMLIGLRASGNFYLRGDKVSMCACYARTTGGTWKDINDSAIDSRAYYWRVSGTFGIPDTIATDFGLIGGPTPVTQNRIGNAANKVSRGEGGGGQFAGYLVQDLVQSGEPGSGLLNWCSFRSVGQYYLGRATVTNCMMRGDATNGGIDATEGASVYVEKTTLVDLPATGIPQVFWSRRKAAVWFDAATVEGDNTGTAADRVVVRTAGDGLVLTKNAWTSALLRAKTTQIRAESGRFVATGTVSFAACEGAGPDLYCGPSGSIHFDETFAKSARNTAASAVLQTSGANQVTQASGKTFSLVTPPSGHWPDSYGAKGPLDLDTLSDVRLGILTGGLAGTTGIGATVKNGARLVHAGAGLAGVAPLDLGGNAAPVAWPAAALTDQLAVAPQGCMVIPNVA